MKDNFIEDVVAVKNPQQESRLKELKRRNKDLANVVHEAEVKIKGLKDKKTKLAEDSKNAQDELDLWRKKCISLFQRKQRKLRNIMINKVQEKLDRLEKDIQ